MSMLGDLLGGAINTYAFDDLLGDLKTHRGEVATEIDNITTDVRGTGGFTPYGVSTRGLGESQFGPGGNLMSNLDPHLEDFSKDMRAAGRASASAGQTMDPYMRQQAEGYYGSSNQAMQNALGMDTVSREQAVYDRIRAMQQPNETRQREAMQANLFGSGRGGMASAAYGGSPEEFAFNKARSEAMNQASLQAMGQAQTEMMNQGQLSQSFGQLGTGTYQAGLQGQQTQGQLTGMFTDAMLAPYAANQQQTQLGLQSSQMQNQQQLELANLLSQLGIGGLTTDVNYANVIGGVYGKMAESAGQAAGATGDLVTDLINSINQSTNSTNQSTP